MLTSKIMVKMDAEDYFIQYVFCRMERSLLRQEARELYDELLKIWQSIWHELKGYSGEDKVTLMGDMFRKRIENRHENKNI